MRWAVKGKTSVDVQDGVEHLVKNIAEPLRVFKLVFFQVQPVDGAAGRGCKDGGAEPAIGSAAAARQALDRSSTV
jgi:hypothetical protein